MSDLTDQAAAARIAFDRIGIPAGELLTISTSLGEASGRTGDIALLDIALDDVPHDDLAQLVKQSLKLAAVRLPFLPERFGDFDRVLFDAGFVRMAPRHDPWGLRGRTTYLRSDLVTDIGHLGEPTGGIVSMTTLGSNGRFGNQMFQWAFLKLYALRTNCRVQAGYWIGTELYGAHAEPSYPKRQRQVFTEFGGIERALWYLDEPPINSDFHGFFQEIPASWRRHKKLFQLMFRPHPDVARPIEQWLADHVPAGATTIGIHIRRGDYLIYDHQRVPWFRPIPIEWYRSLLERLWPTVERPVLILATDEPGLARDFADYAPLVLPAAELVENALQFFPDFHALCRADILTVINSSFSHMAGLLGGDGQRCYIPDMAKGEFVAYAPWLDDGYWERFEA